MNIPAGPGGDQPPVVDGAPAPAEGGPQPQLRRALLAGLATLLVMVAVVVVAIRYTGQDAPSRAPDEWAYCQLLGSAPASKIDTLIMVFMDPDANDAAISEVRALVEADPSVASYRFKDKDEAYADSQRLFAEDPDLLRIVTADILPTSFELVLTGRDEADATVERYSEVPWVKRVVGEDASLPMHVLHMLLVMTTFPLMPGSALTGELDGWRSNTDDLLRVAPDHIHDPLQRLVAAGLDRMERADGGQRSTIEHPDWDTIAGHAEETCGIDMRFR